MLVIKLKKTNHNTKITEIENKLTSHNHDKHADTQEFNKLAADVSNARVAQENLITKTDFDAKLSNLNRKITSNKTKHLLVENELNKLKTFDSSYFIGKSHFDEDGAHNYLVFQPIISYFKVNTITNTGYVLSWKSKWLFTESIKTPTTSDNSFTPELNYHGTKTRVNFTGSCLQQSKISYTHNTIVSIFIVYEMGWSGSRNNDTTLKICFSAVTLTRSTDIDKYKHSDYGIGFDRRSSFSFPSSTFGQNISIFEVDKSSSAHTDNKKRHICSWKRTNTRIRRYFN